MAKGEIFKGLPKAAQGIIAVGGLIIVGFVGYKIYKKIEQDKKDALTKKEQGAIDSELKTLESQGKGKSVPQSQIDQIANELFTAMDGAATDMKAIYAAIAKIKNEADLLAVKASYAIRELSSGKFNPVPNFRGNLSQAFVDELDNLQLAAVNGMLAKKGIKHRF